MEVATPKLGDISDWWSQEFGVIVRRQTEFQQGTPKGKIITLKNPDQISVDLLYCVYLDKECKTIKQKFEFLFQMSTKGSDKFYKSVTGHDKHNLLS